MAIIGVGIYSIETGDVMYLILMLEICIITVIVKGRVLLEIPPMHKLLRYFQTLHRNEDINELKGVLATFEAHLFSSNVEHCSISNVTVKPGQAFPSLAN